MRQHYVMPLTTDFSTETEARTEGNGPNSRLNLIVSSNPRVIDGEQT